MWKTCGLVWMCGYSSEPSARCFRRKACLSRRRSRWRWFRRCRRRKAGRRPSCRRRAKTRGRRVASMNKATDKRLKPVKTVSLVVVARNAQAVIGDLLDDITAQDYPHERIEVLLVDSASTDETKRRFEDFARERQDFIAVTVLDNTERFLPHGCNVALKAYRGDVFLRVDAHARIPADFIRKNVEVLNDGNCVCGGVRPVKLQEQTAWGQTLLLAEESVFGSSPAMYRRTGQVREVSSVFRGAYRREVFDIVGLYNEQLKRTEDNDMSYRIRQQGFKILMDPSISSTHFLRGSFRKMLEQKAGNGYWIGRTLFISPGCLGLFSFVPLVFVLALLVGVVLGLLLGSFAGWLPLIGLVCLYAAVALAVSVISVARASQKNITMAALPFVFLIMHLVYGFATLAGLCVGAVRALFGIGRKQAHGSETSV
ncbi:MAG TPA: glycosyltransferase family 2 protein [Coriobacteriia bacterium]|nr:glycosyltransferase family 2 protein [Coriobacteriia bacterium]